MIVNETLLNEFNSPVRQIRARVLLYNGGTLAADIPHTGELKGFTVERVGESKFFGFGVCQKANLKLIDTENKYNITTAYNFRFVINDDADLLPSFYVNEVRRNENTGELSITAYDAIYEATKHTGAEIPAPPYTIRELAAHCGALIGVDVSAADTLTAFDTAYPDGANLDGTETIRDILNAIAEATQTIYYLNADNVLVFKRLDKDGAAAYEINKDRYISLDSKTNRRLQTISHITELGDNVSASISAIGSTQYIRNNPLWDMRNDVDTLINAAIDAIGGISINQFDSVWRGCPLIEIGDKIALITKDNETAFSYLLDDTITYDGAYSQKSQWKYEDNDTETESNPSSLGDALKQTFARVDKANRQIELLASNEETNANNIASLLLNTNSIAATVQSIEQDTKEALESANNDIEELNNKVSATMTAEEVRIEIQSELSNGANKVITNTGYSFDDSGLTVSKADSEMKTQITDDGMTVYKNDEAVLTANNTGVDAVNLRASTYLIVGTNSRFENYGSNRTGCFWIGEVNN